MHQSADPSFDVRNGAPLVWLIGQPRLSDYIAFVETRCINDGPVDLRALVDEWQRANDLYWRLEQDEGGIADAIACTQPRPESDLQFASIRAHPHFQACFGSLPVTFEWIELDKLVVSQLHVEPGYGPECSALPQSSDDDALLQFCLPTSRPMPPIDVRRVAANRYIFSSPSTDLRAHDIQLARQGVPASFKPHGPVAALLGLTIGFGSNFISGVRSGTRILLQNGHHRAYALRSAGHTHCWCLVETVTRKDELRLTADPDIVDNAEFYFAAKRPPLLKDFFDPRFAKSLTIRPMTTEVEVEINVTNRTSIGV